jgi:2-(acetamidomethylene)succinate hydrolase
MRPRHKKSKRRFDVVQTGRRYESNDVCLASGHSLRYYEWGNSGPNLILLHGSSGYGLMWEWTANDLGETFHVFAPDQRGHGDSDRPDGEYSAEEYARDVHEFMQARELQSAFIGGHSLGGRVAQVFAALYAEQCEGIILVGGVHLSNFYHDRERMAAVVRSACSMFDSPTEFASREDAMAFLRGSRGDRETQASLNHRIEHNMVPRGTGFSVKYDTVRVAQGLMHMATDLRAYAAKVTCPVVILRSTVGSELTPELTPEILKCWTNSSAVDVEGGYLLHVQNPAGTAEAISTWKERTCRN